MDPDVFITIVLSSLVGAFAFAGLVYMLSEHRREAAVAPRRGAAPAGARATPAHVPRGQSLDSVDG